MSEQLTTNRTSRDRRILAVIIWLALIGTAYFLWEGRQSGIIRNSPYEPVAFMLSVYCLFMSVFAWMLFNPSRRATSQSPALFLSGVATLAPPCIIGFCLMPPDSGLRFWLALCLFLLGVVAILSPIPEEFFAIPRSRHTYLLPSPSIDISSDLLDMPETDWLKNSDLTQVVPDTPRSSLAPNAYRVRTPEDRESRRTQRRSERPELWRKPKTSSPGAEQTDSGSTDENRTKPTRNQQKNSQQTTSVDPDSTASKSSAKQPTWLSAFAPGTIVQRDTDSPLPLPDDASSPDQQQQTTSTPHAPEHPISEDATTTLDPFAKDSSSPPVAQQYAAETITDNNRAGRRTDSDSITARQESSSTATDKQNESQPEQSPFERFKDESGAELIEGTMLVRFEPGQKRANIHIPFSPPLPGAPEVECESVGDTPLRLKVPVSQSYGIRIEARRSETDDELESEVGFSAIYNPPE